MDVGDGVDGGDGGPSGLGLARAYHRDVVAPVLAARWPGLPHAVARLGSGSDVLGLDDALSRDHDWGLRLTLLVPADLVTAVDEHLEAALPPAYAGLPTRFATTWDPVVRQRVEVATAAGFAASRLGLDPSGGLDAVDWLCLTGQSVLEVTAGPVFTDTAGTLTRIRQGLAWYPEPVWRYVVAADWVRMAQDLPLLGRTGHRGDDLGSRVLTGRVVQTAVHLALLLARRWPPYPKWTGTALARLPVAADLLPPLGAALTAPDVESRQGALADALAVLGDAQREAGLPGPRRGAVGPFFDRPHLTIGPGVVEDLLDGVTDPLVRRLPAGVGSVEQWVDGVALLTDPPRRVEVARARFARA